MNLLAPTPFLGFNSVYRGAINYVAMAVDRSTVGDDSISDLHFRISGDGERWHAIPIGGDLASATSSAGELPGAFVPVKLVAFGGRMFAFGELWTSSTTNSAAVYVSSDMRTWTKCTIPLVDDGPTISLRGFTDAAANGSYIAGIKPGGQLIYSDDGDTWTGRSDLPLEGAGFRAYEIGAASGGFFIAGNKSGGTALISATTPAATFGDRTHPFGINLMTVAAAGNVALVFAIYSPSNSDEQLISASVSDLTSWTARTYPDNVTTSLAFYGGSKWFAGSNSGDWLESANGTTGWAAAANEPWGEATPGTLTAGYYANGKWSVHYGSGGLAVSDDGDTWTQPASGLAAYPYIAAPL